MTAAVEGHEEAAGDLQAAREEAVAAAKTEYEAKLTKLGGGKEGVARLEKERAEKVAEAEREHAAGVGRGVFRNRLGLV